MDAIVAIGPADLRERLLALLGKGGPHDGRIAQWIEAHPGKDALPALVAALERSPRFSWERKRAIAALKACTGKDHGEDVEAWKREWRAIEDAQDEKRARIRRAVMGSIPPEVLESAPRPAAVPSALLDAESSALSRTTVVPHPRAPMPAGRNVLWCATFQLAWDAMGTDVAKEPLVLGPPAPEGLVAEMNRGAFPRDSLDPDSFLARAGIVRDGIVDSIREELKRRFDAEMKDPGVLAPGGALAYGYLRKALPFEHRFEPIDGTLSFHGGSRKVLAFGANADSFNPDLPRIMRQVTVLHDPPVERLERRGEFILEFAVHGGKDRLLLAMVPPGETLEGTWDQARSRVDPARTRRMRTGEVLKVPKLNFLLDHRFTEVIGATVLQGPIRGQPIAEARQTVRFSLDEGGAELESHALLASLGAHSEFVVDRPFLLALLETGRSRPYFLLWIDNDELLAEAAK
jgi:hypothetical protein